MILLHAKFAIHVIRKVYPIVPKIVNGYYFQFAFSDIYRSCKKEVYCRAADHSTKLF